MPPLMQPLTAFKEMHTTQKTPSSSASLAALSGLALLAAGLGGIIVYVASIVPPFVYMLLAMASVGATLVARELSMDDELAFGVSIADVLVYLVQCMQCFCYFMGLLLALPDISARDLSIMWHGLAVPGAPQEVEEAACKDSKADEVDKLPARQRAFVLAKRWLLRRDLKMGLRDQLRVYGIYRRAIGGSPPITDKQGSSWLERAKSSEEAAHADLSPSAARARLAEVVAEADPLFVAAHPEMAVARPGDPTGTLLNLAERRLPRCSTDLVAVVHRCAFLASASVAVGAAIRLMLRTKGWRSLSGAWLFTAIFGAAASSYSLALVTGLPLSVHVVMARLLGACSPKEGGEASYICARTRQYLRILLTPRVRDALFVQ
mmetsp:Transcript_78669/g.228320  ORF Transcript_78669/g.228320 Transcript_78669/m.228320 type:complete len:377 (+) Transcript_78669:73-1203(+)